MIFAIIILLIIGVVAFFHYVQGFFSATLSAVITIISAVLAVSYHEQVVEAVLGGKAANVAHGMTLAVMFGVIYLVLRVLFDKMVPGNVRFPAILDKVGGAAMGVVAGVFGAGIVALVAQYLPMMPAIAGYSRYTVVGSREVTLPSVGRARQATSEMWHELKSQKPGQFDPADKSRLIVPVDDIVVNTVAHLSDDGSLAGRQKLTAIHPNLLDELFGQRLGMQTGGGRVVTENGVNPVELYHAPALKFQDHDYKELRVLDLKGFPSANQEIRPNAKQLLLIVRVTFTRFGGDEDHWVRFSPGAARLVTHAAGGEMVNYYPIGTVDGARTLYLSKPDDFLLAKDDKGIDFAYLVDRAGFLAGGGAALRVSDGTFFEFKRMARQDLGGKTISAAYKASESVKVERKQAPAGEEAAPEPAPSGAAAGVDELKQRLVGNWAGSSDAGQLIIDFKADGSLSFNNTPGSGVPNVSQGTWEAVRATDANTLIIKRTIRNNDAEATITFTDNDNCTLTSAATSAPIPLKRRS